MAANTTPATRAATTAGVTFTLHAYTHAEVRRLRR
jgi:hypothetical protein